MFSLAQLILTQRIALDVAMAEVVRLAKAGIIVSATDPEEMSAAILRLATNDSERKLFSTNGEKAFKARFTLDAMVNAYLDLYQNSVKSRRAPTG
jgi:glycosyltransferase involved in cell wall biosynthesis